MSSNTKQVPCQNCGEMMARWPVNRKYCGVCQIVRDDHRRQGKSIKPRKCEGALGDGLNHQGETCGTFYPVRSSYKKCYSCTDWKGGERDSHPVCDRCGKRYRTAFGLTKTCMQCVQSSEDLRDQYIKKLRGVYRERMADPSRLVAAEQAERDAAERAAERDAKKKHDARRRELENQLFVYSKGDTPGAYAQAKAEWDAEFPGEIVIF